MAIQQPILELKGVTKKYGDFVAVDSVDLTIQAGEFLTLLGPSGSGKTTILQMIAGFTLPTEGRIYLNGKDISTTPPNKRNMGVVFQDYALFPHMNVYDNIAYPLKIRREDKRSIARQVDEIVELVKLEPFKHRKPSELSGGQQQRVALARALVFRPSLLLMDEPLGALDKKLREHVQLEIKKIQHILGVTIVFVTHDQEEALIMSDRIAVLNQSQLIQLGTARELYNEPNSYFIADFIGKNNFIPGVVVEAADAFLRVKISDNRVVTINRGANEGAAYGDEVYVSVRPENIELRGAEDDEGAADSLRGNRLSGRVSDAIFLGEGVKYLVTVECLGGNEAEISVMASNQMIVGEGEKVELAFAPEACAIFPTPSVSAS